jgi:flavodoxin
MKALIIYYSWTGKTEIVAKAIAKTLNADIRKIEEVKERKGFFGFINGGYCAIKEKSSEIKSMDFNLDNYDIVFLGTPVWASKPAPAINAFVSKAKFNDKKVIVFVTMGSNSNKSAIKVLTDAVESKGGKIINSFAIRTGKVKDKKIIKQHGEDIGKQYIDK